MSEALVITRQEARTTQEGKKQPKAALRRQPAIVRVSKVEDAAQVVRQPRRTKVTKQVAMATADAPDWLFEAVSAATMHPRHAELDRKLEAARRSKAAATSS
ncbi:hypothetical protein CR162_15275 [Pseudoroseomonas rhizosphaerae]|uniref:Uncharacterized protein n=1 Tax=Teichococcus rhizosphaerae TaxID=1335062 RepID=A0A2C6Y012_9PROT|nr:hypothetical protein [Pseudoroseomonas rhizosphaerae]PHK94122.1 hypothetical protein CR162_15275 [Pseudoroseomonas rhizosphaerae]